MDSSSKELNRTKGRKAVIEPRTEGRGKTEMLAKSPGKREGCGLEWDDYIVILKVVQEVTRVLNGVEQRITEDIEGEGTGATRALGNPWELAQGVHLDFLDSICNEIMQYLSVSGLFHLV